MGAETRTSAGDKLEPDALEFMARRARSSRWGRASAFPWARCWKSVP